MTHFSRAKNPLLKTGQTTDYTPAGRTCKDDGGEQRGTDKDYAVLTTGQFSGVTNITVNAKTDIHSNECVVDRRTGLMWSRYKSATVGPVSGTLYWYDATLGEDIFNYCDQANLAGLSGFSDWRIPNFTEMWSLMNCEAPDGLPPASIFPGLPAGNFWTSTTKANDNTYALSVAFAGGAGEYKLKTTSYWSVILVRGGH